MGEVTKEEIRGAIDVVVAVAEVIRKSGEIPSGTLYACLIGVVTLSQFDRVVGILKGANLVEEKNHLLRWIGPVVEGGK